jgi:hypothetical protein
VSGIPFSTIVIAIAMLAFSVLIVSKMGGKIPLSRPAKAILLLFGITSLVYGFYFHLHGTPESLSKATKVIKEEKVEKPAFEFTFSPSQARWGEEVEIRVPFPAESVTVYLNGTPLPKRVSEDSRSIRITIPSGAKTGYLELDRKGARTRATEPIVITP